jgi:hypothetical protein
MSVDIGQSATIQTDKGPVTVYSAEYVAELQAQVELLTGQNARMLSALDGNTDEGADAWIGEDGKITDSCLAWMRERCAPSVAHIQAAAIRRTVVLFGDHYYGTGGGDAVAALSSYADRIEHGAKQL